MKQETANMCRQNHNGKIVPLFHFLLAHADQILAKINFFQNILPFLPFFSQELFTFK